jgi:hypothetical protein
MTTDVRTSWAGLGPAPTPGGGQSAYRVYLPWLACIGLLVVTSLFITLVGGGLEDDPRRVLFEPLTVVVLSVLGGLGVLLASRAGLPAAWDSRISHRRRFVYPLAVGAIFGVVAIALELSTGSIAFFLEETGRERFNAPLPAGVLLYAGGAVGLEVIYRLLMIPLVLWLALRLGFPQRHMLKLFVVLAVLTSLIEPSSQTEVAFAAGRYDLAYSQFALGLAENLAQAFWFLNGGFLAAISVRLGHYAIWHVVYGAIICGC